MTPRSHREAQRADDLMSAFCRERAVSSETFCTVPGCGSRTDSPERDGWLQHTAGGPQTCPACEHREYILLSEGFSQ